MFGRVDVEEKLIAYVREKVDAVDLRRFSQEPAYVTCLLSKLEGVVFKGLRGEKIEIISTIVNDRGPNSAESKFGADFSITVNIESGGNIISKAVLGQAKKGVLKSLSKNESINLDNQTEKMGKFTPHFVILEVPVSVGVRPTIRTSPSHPSNSSMSFEEYIAKILIGCKHGDRRPDFVKSVQNSRLDNLSIIVHT